MRFRPCIDLRAGRVVQIVGGTLRDRGGEPEVNFEGSEAAAHYARMYREDGLYGGHVISLGPSNEEAALEALAAFPDGLQFGGGVTDANAENYLEAGASHVIVTSYVFKDGKADLKRLERLVSVVGRDRLVLDLSCRRRDDAYWVATNRWQHFTDVRIDAETLRKLSAYCDEFLVHGVDVEGRMRGIETDLVRLLGQASPLPVTYAGGARSIEDLDLVNEIGQGRVDLTIGSALDIFGGPASYRAAVAWNRARSPS